LCTPPGASDEQGLPLRLERLDRLVAWPHLVGRIRQLGTVVGFDRQRVGFGFVGLGQTGQCGHGGLSSEQAAIMRPRRGLVRHRAL
jgi:hypothetical protein